MFKALTTTATSLIYGDWQTISEITATPVSAAEPAGEVAIGYYALEEKIFSDVPHTVKIVSEFEFTGDEASEWARFEAQMDNGIKTNHYGVDYMFSEPYAEKVINLNENTYEPGIQFNWETSVSATEPGEYIYFWRWVTQTADGTAAFKSIDVYIMQESKGGADGPACPYGTFKYASLDECVDDWYQTVF